MLEQWNKLERLERGLSRLLPPLRPAQTVDAGCLLDFVPVCSPELVRPDWLGPLAEAFDAAMAGPIELGFSVPPRHGKTELVLHGLARALIQHPEWPLLYASHTATFAATKSKAVRALAKRCGVQLSEGSNRADEWQTTAGGGLVARGVGGEVTGRGFRIIVIDDPIKSREQAESPVYREKTWSWLTSDIFSRLTPDGAVIVVHTRWHPDDPLGRMEDDGVSVITRRAIAEPGDDREAGTCLSPELGWTVDVLEKRRRRVGEYAWASLYQGRPRPRGGSVFGPPTYYTALPESLRYGHGADLAYTAKTQADYSVMVTMANHRPADAFYVVDCVRRQVSAPDFSLAILGQHQRRPGPILFRGSGTEKGTGQFIAQRLPRGSWRQEQATGDKGVNALDYAAAWNDGRILLPDPEAFPAEWATWVSDYVEEHERFTGISDAHDDQVDAAGSAHRVLDKVPPAGAYTDDKVRRRKFPKRRM